MIEIINEMRIINQKKIYEWLNKEHSTKYWQKKYLAECSDPKDPEQRYNAMRDGFLMATCVTPYSNEIDRKIVELIKKKWCFLCYYTHRKDIKLTKIEQSKIATKKFVTYRILRQDMWAK